MKINGYNSANYQLFQPVKTRSAEPVNNDPNVVNLTSEEKEFFTKMYPDQKNNIAEYHFYQNNGKMKGISVGTLINRRG